jgi:hypothetical protein
MKLVVDSNRLQSDELRAFLSQSTKNVAVLSDYAAMEAYKGDTLTSIFRSMGVLADFPKQVIVLKGTRAACAQRGRAAGLQRRRIDNAQTLEFPQFVSHLRRAQQGHPGLERQLLEHGLAATEHLEQMLADAHTTGSMIEEFATLYSKEDRRNIRAGENLSAEAVHRTVQIVMQIAGRAFHQHPDVNFAPSHEELGNTFIFRVALATYLLVLDWAARGGALGASPAKLRNDFVDMNFAAYASYFDGLMSADAKVLRLHAELRLWLIALFDCQLLSGLGWYAPT